MTQVEQISALWRQLQSTGDTAVLATVVKTQGSSYRLPGARLLIAADGRRAGSVSGGCLEDDLVKKAWWLTDSGPVFRRYDTTPDGEIGPSFGLGCNGIIDVLLDRVRPGEPVLRLLDDVREQRRPAVIAHVIQPRERAGERLMLDTNGQANHNLHDGELANWLEREARLLLRENVTRSIASRNGLHVFVEVMTPPIHLLLFGAGDDAMPVTELAKFFGWRVSVIDGRAHYARRERFPQANTVLVHSSNAAFREVIDPWTAAVLMTHSYSQDLHILRELAGAPLAYLGILGPRKRTAQLLEDAGLTSADCGAALHSPMGLDLGADGPEQVALAVIAEIQATFNGRQGGLLRERAGSIHSEENGADETAAPWRPSAACAL